MSGRALTSVGETQSTPLLEVIRRQEGEVKRRLAVAAGAARADLDTAQSRAREVIAAAEADGRSEGEHERQLALAEADAEAWAIVAEACGEAELLQRVGAQRMEAAIRRVVALVSGVRP